jgi:hypothetical protein
MSNRASAARTAATWWGDRMGKMECRTAFVDDLTARIQTAMSAGGLVKLTCDYDPWDILLDSVRATVDPMCQGVMFSAREILPEKCRMRLQSAVGDVWTVEAREGYGSEWEAVPVAPTMLADVERSP